MTDEDLIDEQIRYYDDRAPEYEDYWFRRGAYVLGADEDAAWFRETAIVEAAVDAFDLSGSVLELACGSGVWTRRIAPRARRLVAVDSSPAMIELNRERFGRASVEYVLADLFSWEPPERFDAALAGFIVSHIPAERWTAFWGRLATWLRPGAGVFLVDESVGRDRPASDVPVTDGSHPQRRTLGDRTYTIVKRYWTPGELQHALADLGWSAALHASGRRLFYGIARPV
ncbi:MAG TPA: class I SAM-dependent methyltransferase [Actinomycetota bacterium]|jgi:demethylmenaquinone methyltransferase/2-methoxy-6-polyprenyl-1,4-benzoquinol methylase